MMWKNKFLLILISTIFSLPHLLDAQSLKGKIIYITPSKEITIKFPSAIIDFNVENKASVKGFQFRTSNRNQLYIRANMPPDKNTNLTVNEGRNTHQFILEYINTPDGVSETVYDYSKSEALAREANRMQQAVAKQPSLSGSTVSRQPVSSPVQTPSKATLEMYTDLEMKANVAYTAGRFDEAKALYQKALNLQPTAAWPAWQLIKIDEKKLATVKNVKESGCDNCYAQHKNSGDSALSKNAYSYAKTEYTRALHYKYNDRYVASQIVKIEKLEKDMQYTEFMKQGREALASSSLTAADAAFRSALKLRAKDPEAKKGIAAVANKSATLLKMEEAEKRKAIALNRYNDTLAVADALFQNASYEAAKKAYKNAEQLRPGELYARTKIAQADSILFARKVASDKLKKEAALAATKNSTIARPERSIETTVVKTETITSGSNEQLSMHEKEAAKKIPVDHSREAIQPKKEVTSRQRKTESETTRYNRLLKEGNAAFALKEYEKARGYFLEALAIKPGETIPRSQAQLMNRKLEEQAREDRYKYFVRLADSSAFKARDYVQALRYYDSAHAVKPQEGYAKTQVILINDQLARAASKTPPDEKQKERSEKFNEAFKVYRKADEARIERKYAEAYSGFNAFLDHLGADQTSNYLINERYYINQAKTYLQEMERQKSLGAVSSKETGQEDSRKKANAKKDN